MVTDLVTFGEFLVYGMLVVIRNAPFTYKSTGFFAASICDGILIDYIPYPTKMGCP